MPTKQTLRIFGCSRTNRKPARQGKAAMECLETRRMLSGTSYALMAPAAAAAQVAPYYVAAPSTSGADAMPAIVTPDYGNYTAAQIRTGYGLGSLSDSSYTNRGQGQTIAIVDCYDTPTIMQDLTQYSIDMGLPLPTSNTFQVVYASGTQPLADQGWSVEEDLDVEAAHAIAPDAKIILVEAATANDADAYAAVDTAVALLNADGGGVISMSWGEPENSSGFANSDELADEAHFDNVGNAVSFVAATGDAAAELSYPALSPEVTAVGGTSLYLGSDGNRTSETAWSSGGGGISHVLAVPTYQAGVTINGTPLGAYRASPDVAMMANPATGFAMYYYKGYMLDVGGTSVSTPLFAGMVALANQLRSQAGAGPIGSSLNQAIYSIAGSSYATAFNDITSGGNGNPAYAGFDLATGWGSPQGPTFATQLAGQARSGLTGAYYPTIDLSGTPTPETDNTVDFNWGTAGPTALNLPAWNATTGSSPFSVIWSGSILADQTGTYTFSTLADDGIKVIIDGTTVISNWTDTPRLLGDCNLDGTVNSNDLLSVLQNYGVTGVSWQQGAMDGGTTVNSNDLLYVLQNYGVTVAPQATSGTITLAAGWHSIEVDYYQKEAVASVQLDWTTPDGNFINAIVPASHLSTAKVTAPSIANTVATAPSTDSTNTTLASTPPSAATGAQMTDVATTIPTADDDPTTTQATGDSVTTTAIASPPPPADTTSSDQTTDSLNPTSTTDYLVATVPPAASAGTDPVAVPATNPSVVAVPAPVCQANQPVPAPISRTPLIVVSNHHHAHKPLVHGTCTTPAPMVSRQHGAFGHRAGL